MEVAEKDGCFGAGDDEDDENEEEEAVHVVDLAAPDAVKDEEELDEDASEGQDTAHDDTGDGLGVDGLVGDLPGDLVGPDRLLDGRLPEAEVGADEGERHRHPEPEGQEGHQGEEGDGGGGAVVPEDEVQDEEVCEDDPGAEHGGEEDVTLPLLSTEALVNPVNIKLRTKIDFNSGLLSIVPPGGHVSCRSPQADEQHQGAGHQSSPGTQV